MKRILIIGGTSGYGAGIAQVLKDQNEVVISSRHAYNSLDVRDAVQVEAFFKEFLENDIIFDAVIYSAGKAIGKDLVAEKISKEFEDVFATNTLGLLYVAKAAHKHLSKSKGHFIHIGSIAHALNYKGGADYCASKSASNTIMKTLRIEWLGSGIRTTSLEVGLGATDFQKNRYAGDESKMAKHTTGVRQIEPTDLGNLVKHILETPDYLNIDEVVFKPIDQASHGITVDNIDKQF